MAQKTAALLPATQLLLRHLGERLRLARRRRRLTAKQLTERAGMSPMTLRSLERGGSGVTIGAYLGVMQALGMEKDLDLLAQADSVGRALQDAGLPERGVVSPRRSPRAEPAPPAKSRDGIRRKRWIEQGGFESSAALAKLVDRAPAASKRKR